MVRWCGSGGSVSVSKVVAVWLCGGGVVVW